MKTCFFFVFFLSLAISVIGQTSTPFDAAVTQSWRRVAATYPEAVRDGSPSHEFLQAQITEVYKTDPHLFEQSTWPEMIAVRYAVQLAALKSTVAASSTPSPSPATLDPVAFQKAVEQSKERVAARYPDVNKPGTYLYMRAGALKQSWSASPYTQIFQTPDWPEKLLQAALDDLATRPPLKAANIKASWIQDIRKERLPESEYGHGKVNADLDEQERVINSGLWDVDAEGQADRSNASVLRAYGLADAANRLDAAAATIEAQCKERDEKAKRDQQQTDAIAGLQEQQKRAAGAQWMQNWQTQQQINQIQQQQQWQQTQDFMNGGH